jgi:hypothetical protein
VGFPGASLAHQQDRLGLGHVAALGQRSQLPGRDAGAVELEGVWTSPRGVEG